MFEIICPKCGAKRHGFTEEEAIESYDNHLCMDALTSKEISAILDRVRGKDESFGSL